MSLSLHYVDISDGKDPLVRIQSEALDRSGLSYERAFAIDTSNMANEVDFTSYLNLADVFYTRLTKDPNSKFVGMFRDLELQMKHLADFLYQRSGGGNQYTDRKGFIPIAESHAHLEIDEELAEKWLDVMEDSLDRCRQDFTEDQRQHLLDFMRYTAYEIIVWGRYRKSIIKKGPQF